MELKSEGGGKDLWGSWQGWGRPGEGGRLDRVYGTKTFLSKVFVGMPVARVAAVDGEAGVCPPRSETGIGPGAPTRTAVCPDPAKMVAEVGPLPSF